MVELKLVDDHVFGALAPGLSLETNSAEASLILIQDFLSEGLCIGELSENYLSVLFEGVFGTLWHALPLSHLLALDPVLLVQSAQACH